MLKKKKQWERRKKKGASRNSKRRLSWAGEAIKKMEQNKPVLRPIK